MKRFLYASVLLTLMLPLASCGLLWGGEEPTPVDGFDARSTAIPRPYRGESSKIPESPKETPAKDEQGKAAFMEDQDERPKGKPSKIFGVGSDLAVQNGGTPPHFTLNKKYYITELWTYHWNDSRGTPPGTIAIKAANGKMFGPWKAKLYNDVYWVARPNSYVPAGSYTVIDSDPATLAQNAETGGQGMSWAHGIAAK